MKEWLLSILSSLGSIIPGALITLLVGWLMKRGDAKITEEAEKRKEKKEKEERLDSSSLELEKVKEAEKIDIARLLAEQVKDARDQEDETRKRYELLLSKENERLWKENERLGAENFQLRENLQTALQALRLGLPKEQAAELGKRLTTEIQEISKD